MIRTNLFIKIAITIQFAVLRPILVTKRLTILVPDQDRLETPNCFIMSHDIKESIKEQKPQILPFTFLLLHRDLEPFCDSLANFQFTIEEDSEATSHIITLIKSSLVESETAELYPHELQDLLIAPYIRKLRGFPRLTIQGAIADKVATDAMALITRPQKEDRMLFCRSLKH